MRKIEAGGVHMDISVATAAINRAMDEMGPPIALVALPEEEQVNAGHLCQCLRDLRSYERQFAGALTLFDFGMRNRDNKEMDGIGWAMVAARDGGMTIYHFSKTLGHSGALLGKCKALLRMTDRTKLRSARKHLNEAFSNSTEVRHAIAHTAELTMSPEKTRENALSGPYDKHGMQLSAGVKVMIRNSLNGRLFQNTIDGKLQSYEISRASLDALISIRREYWSAFAWAAHATCARAREINSGQKKTIEGM
jgi:hypothetical protein